MNKMPLYLDSASTTPVDHRVLDVMQPYFSEIFGNASSNHIYGKHGNEDPATLKAYILSI